MNEEDTVFILERIEMPDEIRAKLERRDELTEEEADDLRDLCSDRLLYSGFDINYHPTAEGRRLEEMIDKLYTG